MSLIKRASIVFIIYALMLNGLLFAAPAGMYGDAETKQLSAVFGEKVFICTPDGYKWSSWAELGKEKHQKTSSCKMCSMACKNIDGAANAPEVTILKQPADVFAKQNNGFGISVKLANIKARSPPYSA